MTVRGDTAELVGVLPFELRADVRAYLSAIEESVPDIFLEARVEPTNDRTAEFLYFATLRKLWLTVDATHVALTQAIRLIGRAGIHEVQIGPQRYGRQTPDYQQILDLRNGLMNALKREGLFEVVAFSSLSELVEHTAREQS